MADLWTEAAALRGVIARELAALPLADRWAVLAVATGQALGDATLATCSCLAEDELERAIGHLVISCARRRLADRRQVINSLLSG